MGFFLGQRETNNKISNTFIMIQKGFTLILNSILFVRHMLSIFHGKWKSTLGNETPTLTCTYGSLHQSTIRPQHDQL